MSQTEPAEPREYDKVTQASLNGIYVKAKELDRGHNDCAAPRVVPAGASVAEGAPDAETRASDAWTHASDAETHASDVGQGAPCGEDR